MRLQTIKSITVAAGLSAILGALLCAPVGCKKAADDAVSESSDASNDGGAGDGGGGSGGADGGEIVTDMSRDSFDQMKSLWQTQVAGPVASADTLRKLATEHPDAQLNDLVTQLEKKAAEVKVMIDGATYPKDIKTLQTDVPRLMGEAGELAQKAHVRLQEVIKASIPGGGA